jgi:quercetin dioxygenase-like cupin family protein
MKITPRSEAQRTERPMTSHFTGEAHSHELIPATPEATAIFGAVVRFEAGARNHWHSHPGGQLLHVVAGEGWVQVRGAPPQRIRLGDTVTSDPGEEHWHGAGTSGPMAHLAVAAGETRWLEESSPPPQ